MKNEMEVLFANLKNRQFVIDAINKHGEEKITKLFNRAWEFGHSDGDNSVKDWLMELIDVLDC